MGFKPLSWFHKVVIGLLAFLCILLLIWLAKWLAFRPEFVKTDSLQVCLNDRIRSFQKKLSEFDAVRVSDATPGTGITFVGNGFFGCSFQEEGLFLNQSGSLSLKLHVLPLISLDVHGYLSDFTFILDIKDGIMYKVNCFKHENELCISSGTMVYAHRLFRSLLVQNFRVYNPLDWDNTVKVNKHSLRTWGELKTMRTVKLRRNNFQTDSYFEEDVNYEVVSGIIQVSSDEQSGHETGKTQVIVVVIYEPVFPDTFTVGSGKTQSFSFITGIRASSQPLTISAADLAQTTSDFGVIGRERRALETRILRELEIALLQLSEPELRAQHIIAWNRLWMSGLTLSYSFANRALNGDRANTTLYYLAASSPDLFSTITMSADPKHKSSSGNNNYSDTVVNNNRNASVASLISEYRRRAADREHCYNESSDLLHSESHWPMVTSVSHITALTDLWRSSLIRGGCQGHLDDGVHGILQATLLAIGRISLSQNLVSFDLSVSTLYRDVGFRRVQLNKPGVFADLDVAIVPGEASVASPHLMVIELGVTRSQLLAPPAGLNLRQTLSQEAVPIATGLDPSIMVISSRNRPVFAFVDPLVKVERDASAVPVYVCPAVCRSDPVKVKYSRVVMPYLETKPPSAILHLSNDWIKLKEGTRRAYAEIRAGPNPKHELITLHRHGHAFGGLPWLFWICLGLSIALIHIFLCKIIYNELWRGDHEEDHLPFVHTRKVDLRSFNAVNIRNLIKAEVDSRRRPAQNLDYIP